MGTDMYTNKNNKLEAEPSYEKLPFNKSISSYSLFNIRESILRRNVLEMNVADCCLQRKAWAPQMSTGFGDPACCLQPSSRALPTSCLPSHIPAKCPGWPHLFPILWVENSSPLKSQFKCTAFEECSLTSSEIPKLSQCFRHSFTVGFFLIYFTDL